MLKVLGNVVSIILLRSALPSLEQNFSEVQLVCLNWARETKLDFRFLLKFPFDHWAAAPLDPPLNAYFSSSSSSAAATCVLVKLSPLDAWWWNASCVPCVGVKIFTGFCGIQ